MRKRGENLDRQRPAVRSALSNGYCPLSNIEQQTQELPDYNTAPRIHVSLN